MTNYATGHLAEIKAAEYLKQQGFKVRELNWKTPYAEIDVVAEKDKSIFFIEVKYRKTSLQGTGLDYITPTKLDKMKRAAEMWVTSNGWPGSYTVGALEISGSNYEVTAFLYDYL
jgi:putative endonuclease